MYTMTSLCDTTLSPPLDADTSWKLLFSLPSRCFLELVSISPNASCFVRGVVDVSLSVRHTALAATLFLVFQDNLTHWADLTQTK